MPPDGRMYSSSSRKGETAELKHALNSIDQRERQKAVKRVIASMTIGKDVSSLFPDVIKNAMTDNFSLKKLVYLYIINYARSNPDLIILVINTFVKDAADRNPLVRALSLRTMALIRLDKVTEYLVDPLHKALRDEDPYVRKTAAVCVAKLYDSNPALVREEGFIHMLQDLLSDANPMTVANAVASLSEIAEASNTPSLLSLTPSSVPKYLSALSECTEWGQVFILDAISSYKPQDSEEAQLMVERIIPRLQHANPAVVLAAVRINVALMPCLDSVDQRSYLINKMRAPIVTLLSAQPEMQYAALRNINLLIRAYPTFFENDPRVFFASYADPLYVKVEKLDILARIADKSNTAQILAELEEYASEVDLVFARKAVGSIGRIALSRPGAVAECVKVLTKLLRAKTLYITEEVVITMKDILRAYPGRFLSVIDLICDSAEVIDEPLARAALVWIVGEHAASIPNAPAMIDVFLDTYHDEMSSVQLQIVSAAVKAYLTRGQDAQASAQRAMSCATDGCDRVDVRERGIMYARLIGADLDTARRVVLAAKPGIRDDSTYMDTALLGLLLANLGTVASVYHLPVDHFQGAVERSSANPVRQAVEDLLGLEDNGDEGVRSDSVLAITEPPAAGLSFKKGGVAGHFNIDDFLGIGGESASSAPRSSQGSQGHDIAGATNFLGTMQILESANPAAGQDAHPCSETVLKVLLPADKGKGLAVRGGLVQLQDGRIMLELQLENQTQSSMTDFAIQLNKNAFGFVPTGPMVVRNPLPPGAADTTHISLAASGTPDCEKGVVLQIAIKFSPGGVVYFAEKLVETLDSVLATDGGRMDKASYLKAWASVSDVQEVTHRIHIGSRIDARNLNEVVRLLEVARLFVVAKRNVNGADVLYFSGRVVGAMHTMLMAELTLPSAHGAPATLASRSPVGAIAIPFLQALGGTCQRLLQ
jgi:vesicle coat complex subunit